MTGKEILTIPVGKLAIVGKTALIDCPNGDSYCGEIVEQRASRIILTEYTVWYEGETDPVDGFEDGEITLTITDDSIIHYL